MSRGELEVIVRLGDGMLNKEMATRLGISINTVRTHLRRIYTKLSVNSRTEATAKYFQR